MLAMFWTWCASMKVCPILVCISDVDVAVWASSNDGEMRFIEMEPANAMALLGLGLAEVAGPQDRFLCCMLRDLCGVTFGVS